MSDRTTERGFFSDVSLTRRQVALGGAWAVPVVAVAVATPAAAASVTNVTATGESSFDWVGGEGGGIVLSDFTYFLTAEGTPPPATVDSGQLSATISLPVGYTTSLTLGDTFAGDPGWSVSGVLADGDGRTTIVLENSTGFATTVGGPTTPFAFTTDLEFPGEGASADNNVIFTYSFVEISGASGSSFFPVS